MKIKFDTIEALAKQPKGRMLEQDEIDDVAARIALQIFFLNMKQWLMPISELPLSVRAVNVMKRHNIRIVYELRALDPRDIVNLKNAGRMVRQEMREVVERACNLKLPNWDERMMKGAQS